MNYIAEKELFTKQLKNFADTLAMHIAKDDEWTIRGFIDIFKNAITPTYRKEQ